MVSLRVTVAGELFVDLFGVFTLPFSNWQWATVCLSESLAALRRGIQAALFQLGALPVFVQTDNFTAATHRIPTGAEARVEGRRHPFNSDYLALVRHFAMTPRTTEIGAKEQSGDVEAQPPGAEGTARAGACRARTSRLREPRSVAGYRPASLRSD